MECSVGGKMPFRNQEVSYGHSQFTDTFYFVFGDGEFIDAEGDAYCIQFEYHISDKEWIVMIWWEDDNICIEELDESDADEYITKEEIGEVISFAKQFIK